MLEIPRLGATKQVLQLVPRLYPEELATRPQPFHSIDAMWLVLGTLASKKTQAINDEKCFLLPAVYGGCLFTRSGPPIAALGEKIMIV